MFSVGSLWKRSSQLFFINSALSASILLSTLITLYLVSLFNNFNWWFVGGLFSSFLILFRYLILIIYSFYEGNYFNKASAIAHIGLGLLILATTFNASLSYEKVINIKLNQEVDIKVFNDDFNLSQSADKTSIIMHYSDVETDASLDRLLTKIKKENYKVLNIDTEEKSLEEIFLDVVGK